jgi:hypothetical protein
MSNFRIKILLFLAISVIFLSCETSKTLKFKKIDYGVEWPYSVNEIEIYCNGYDELYFKADNGKTYPLNGTAKGSSRSNSEISDIQEIWLDNPNLIGTKIPYPQEFITKGLSLCENRN